MESHFPADYRGDVYVHLAASVTKSVAMHVIMRWGTSRSFDRVEVEPGLVFSGRGGTLIGTGKQNSTLTAPDDPNPVLVVETDIPVCANFGTGRTAPKPVPNAYIRANWL